MIYFEKMHCAGNSYIAVNGIENRLNFINFTRDICDYNRGVGSDGLVVAQSSDTADAKMKIFNPEGSEAEISGNGLRILAKFIVDNQLVKMSKEDEISIETNVGTRSVTYTSRNSQIHIAKVNIGLAEFKIAKLPVEHKNSIFKGHDEFIAKEVATDFSTEQITLVSMGNPHAVICVDELSEKANFHERSSALQSCGLFPFGVNVEFVKLIDRDTIQTVIYERGVGKTLSSGTGCSAAANVMFKLGLTEENVTVEAEGGIMSIQITKNGTIISSAVTRICTGYLNYE